MHKPYRETYFLLDSHLEEKHVATSCYTLDTPAAVEGLFLIRIFSMNLSKETTCFLLKANLNSLG